MNLKQQLFKDFNIDFPISGGSGCSISDPIIIHSSNPQEVLYIEFLYISCIYKAIGQCWRNTDIIREYNADHLIDKFKLDVKFLEGESVVEEKRNIYFSVDPTLGNLSTKMCYVSIPNSFSLTVPFEIGWAHFDKITNEEESCPGTGFSLAYSFPQTEMTIYAYRGEYSSQDFLNKDYIINNEMKKSTDSIKFVYEEAKLLKNNSLGGIDCDFYELGGAYTAIAVTVLSNIILKLRITVYSEEGFLWKCFHSTIASFLRMCSRSSNYKEKIEVIYG